MLRGIRIFEINRQLAIKSIGNRQWAMLYCDVTGCSAVVRVSRTTEVKADSIKLI
jgi:hypothetical protein